MEGRDSLGLDEKGLLFGVNCVCLNEVAIVVERIHVKLVLHPLLVKHMA